MRQVSCYDQLEANLAESSTRTIATCIESELSSDSVMNVSRNEGGVIRVVMSAFSMKARVRVVMAMLLVLNVVLGGIVAVSALTTSDAGVRGVVLFVGDSNETLGAGQIVRNLTWQSHNDNGYVPVMASRVGAGIRTPDCLDPTGCTTYDYWQLKLANIGSKVTADAVVVNLGINDASALGTATTPGYANYGKKIDWLMGLLGERLVIWTNLPCSLEPVSFQHGCEQIDYQLAAAKTRWANLKVANWNMQSQGHPEYMTTGDVHLTNTGQQAWVDLVLAYLDANLGAP